MKHSSASRGGVWAGRAMAAAATLAIPAGLAFGADTAIDGLTRICYNGSEATVSQNVLGDYLGDGATLGSCAEAQSQTQAQAASSSSAAPAMVAPENSQPGIFGFIDSPVSLWDDAEARETDPVQPSDSAKQEAADTAQSVSLREETHAENDGENSRMTLSISTSLNGRTTERRQVWENGELVVDTAGGLGLNLGFPFGGALGFDF